MFNCYKKGYCQNNYNPDAIETACSNVGTTAEYAQINSMNMMNMGCGCGCNNGCLGNLFGGDSEILFFIIIFLLLFTSFGYNR